jgi:hypothetical protein
MRCLHLSPCSVHSFAAPLWVTRFLAPVTPIILFIFVSCIPPCFTMRTHFSFRRHVPCHFNCFRCVLHEPPYDPLQFTILPSMTFTCTTFTDTCQPSLHNVKSSSYTRCVGQSLSLLRLLLSLSLLLLVTHSLAPAGALAVAPSLLALAFPCLQLSVITPTPLS